MTSVLLVEAEALSREATSLALRRHVGDGIR